MDESTAFPTNFPLIELAGSENWRRDYEVGEQYEALWPNQGGYDFAYACGENTYGPCEGHHIVNLVMEKEGERDEGAWIWLVTLDNEESYRCVGWCDYTGWDCRSGVDWSPAQ